MDLVGFQNKASQDFLKVGREPKDDPEGIQISSNTQGFVPRAVCPTNQP